VARIAATEAAAAETKADAERQAEALKAATTKPDLDFYFAHHAVLLVWTIGHYDLPNSAAAAQSCKDILSELKQMDKAIEIGISYNRFCEVLQEKAMTVEKLKDACPDPDRMRDFLYQADECIDRWVRAKDHWRDKIEAEGEGSKALDDYFLHEAFGEADCHLLYCKGVVSTNLSNEPVYLKVARLILLEQSALKSGVLPDSHAPVLPPMTEKEIVMKIKAAEDKLRKEASPAVK
jgi:hypothetical protein